MPLQPPGKSALFCAHPVRCQTLTESVTEAFPAPFRSIVRTCFLRQAPASGSRTARPAPAQIFRQYRPWAHGCSFHSCIPNVRDANPLGKFALGHFGIFSYFFQVLAKRHGSSSFCLELILSLFLLSTRTIFQTDYSNRWKSFLASSKARLKIHPKTHSSRW